MLQVFSEAERSGTRLPASLLQRLADVKQRVDQAAKEAAAAEAAVQAVEQVVLALDLPRRTQVLNLSPPVTGVFGATRGGRKGEEGRRAGGRQTQGVYCQPRRRAAAAAAYGAGSQGVRERGPLVAARGRRRARRAQRSDRGGGARAAQQQQPGAAAATSCDDGRRESAAALCVANRAVHMRGVEIS